VSVESVVRDDERPAVIAALLASDGRLEVDPEEFDQRREQDQAR
jgi:hypothetical protein